jgi:hypothetical protein
MCSATLITPTTCRNASSKGWREVFVCGRARVKGVCAKGVPFAGGVGWGGRAGRAGGVGRWGGGGGGGGRPE